MIYSIIVYYGSLPNYFQLYLDSLSLNIGILKIIFITDIDFSNYKIPENFIHILLPIISTKKRIVSYFKNYHKIKVKKDVLPFAYKLCDFKVIYKFLFLDILENNGITENDYWGWSDCDLIYGNLFKNITNINALEFIGWNGHFTAIRNNKLYDNYILNMKDLVEQLLSPRYELIDEKGYRIMLKKYVIGKLPYLCLKDINPKTNVMYILDVMPMPSNPLKRFHAKLYSVKDDGEEIKYILFDKKNKQLVVEFTNKNRKEFVYVHLQKRKMKINFHNYTDIFYINHDSFTNNGKKIYLN